MGIYDLPDIMYNQIKAVLNYVWSSGVQLYQVNYLGPRHKLHNITI